MRIEESEKYANEMEKYREEIEKNYQDKLNKLRERETAALEKINDKIKVKLFF